MLMLKYIVQLNETFSQGRQDRPEVLSNLFLNPYNKPKSIYQSVLSKTWFTFQKMRSKSTFNLSRWNQFSFLQANTQHSLTDFFFSLLAQLHQVSVCPIITRHHHDLQNSQVQQATPNEIKVPSKGKITHLHSLWTELPQLMQQVTMHFQIISFSCRSAEMSNCLCSPLPLVKMCIYLSIQI